MDFGQVELQSDQRNRNQPPKPACGHGPKKQYGPGGFQVSPLFLLLTRIHKQDVARRCLHSPHILGSTLNPHTAAVHQPLPCPVPRCPCPTTALPSLQPTYRREKNPQTYIYIYIYIIYEGQSTFLVWGSVACGTTHWMLAHVSLQGQLQRHGKALPTREVIGNRRDGTLVLYN